MTYNIPMALDIDLSRTEGLRPSLAYHRNRGRAAGAREYVLGPMPIDAFVDSFLPAGHDRRGLLSPKNAFKAVPQSASDAARVYKPLATALNKKTKHKARCPGFVFERTIERSIRPLRLGFTKPHICCFSAENAVRVRKADASSRVDFGFAEFFIEVNSNPSMDLFTDPPPDAEQGASSSHVFLRDFALDTHPLIDQLERRLGLHIAFAAEIFARQHRRFLFSMSVSGSSARLFRWDRAGCVVSEAFDIRERPEPLIEFLWRFAQTSQAGRGHDPTVSAVTAQEEILFRDTIRGHVRTQLEIEGDVLDKAVTAHYQPGQVTAIHVHSPSPTRSGWTVDRFITSRPVVSPLSLESRGTRGYWAVCARTRRMVFLKDTWRTRSSEELEGDIVQQLNELGVRNVPGLVVHGDVPDDVEAMPESVRGFQSTDTHRFMGEPWVSRIDDKDIYVSKLRHYRIVTDTAGYDLKNIRGTQELLHATYDAFQAMRDALAKDSRIHRDISAGNIILYKEPGSDIRRGYLVDWEASDLIDDTGEALHRGRAGTWEFLSMRMLEPEQKDGKHTFQDDMEAMLYVVLYCALLYLAHDAPMPDLTTIIRRVFRDRTEYDDVICGGEGKLANAILRKYTGRVKFGSAALQEWLDTVMNFHSPPAALKDKYKGMWDPDRLDSFWSAFLEKSKLERDDRVVHTLSMSGCYDLNTPRSTPPPSPPREPLTRKRRLEASGLADDDPLLKKARAAEEDVATPPSRPVAAGCATSPLPRRSERIRNRSNKAVSGAAVKATPTPARRGRPSRRSPTARPQVGVRK
ncbi:hypothetical protein OH77DRAFT_1431105 [Trametes cingulata]|nr:hypothetical protein OH77DRAFT_1431105 [Trametes cingulata]